MSKRTVIKRFTLGCVFLVTPARQCLSLLSPEKDLDDLVVDPTLRP